MNGSRVSTSKATCLPGIRGPLLVLALLCGACGPSGPMQLKLEYAASESIDVSAISGAYFSVPVQIGRVSDARKDKQDLVGRNVERDEPVPVLASSEAVVETVRTGLRGSLGAAMNLVEDAPTQLDVRIKQLWVEEGNLYEATVLLNVRVLRAGAPVAEMLVGGEDKRWGGSFEQEMYREAIGNAIVEASSNLMKMPEFGAAIMRASATPSEPGAGAF